VGLAACLARIARASSSYVRSVLPPGEELGKDTVDREAVVDAFCRLEQKFQFAKVKLLLSYQAILKGCYHQKWRTRFVCIMEELTVREPALRLAAGKLFEQYHMEISKLISLRHIVEDLF